MVEEILGEERQPSALKVKAVAGIFHLCKEGYGFLRPSSSSPSAPDDIYVSPSQVRRFGLKAGDSINGQARPPKGVAQGERYYALVRFEQINEQLV